ncbi:MAG TPA: SMC-Scp complex subunit ScpB [Thermoanaerobaculia bacterium]|nr:SMC-Scp complex subunit ScpB [Thermoanaerobaculia bacterium]
MTDERNDEPQPNESSDVAVQTAPEPEAPPPPADALPAIEALLFASGKPVSLEGLAEASELSLEAVSAAVDELEKSLEGERHGIRLDRVAGGVRLVTRAEHDYAVRRLLGLDGKNKLSIAALETLAIVAYRQPVTAPEVAELRGVSSASSIRTLLDRKLITTAGRKEVVGTPFLYKTTKEFLVHFGLSEISEMPKPEELEALYGGETTANPDEGQQPLFSEDELEGNGEEPAEASGEEGAKPVAESETDATTENIAAVDDGSKPEEG